MHRLGKRAYHTVEIEHLLQLSVAENASDLHLIPNLPPLIRKDGDLFALKDYAPMTSDIVKGLIYNLMNENQILHFETNLVLDFAVTFPDLGNFRVSALHEVHGVAAVLRVIPDKVPSFSDLALPTVFKRLLGLSHGIILITGSTGSGKSTTLAAMLDYINNTQNQHIITIEDPIEFIHTSKRSAINQIQVGRDTPNFATALRASLRQDPNVILLGELRDLETIRLALIAAETGHLVFSTLHASTAPLAINRIVDVFPAEEKYRIRNLLAETVQGVICQTLVKKANGGRAAAFEIMLATPAIRHMIRQDFIVQMESAMQTNNDIGMCTMAQYLQKLAQEGVITSVAARSIAVNRESFQPVAPPPSKKGKK
jgi:twitching motility protein PilT